MVTHDGFITVRGRTGRLRQLGSGLSRGRLQNSPCAAGPVRERERLDSEALAPAARLGSLRPPADASHAPDYSKSYLDLIMARLRPAAGARLPAATAGSGAGAPVALGRLDHVPHVAAVDGVHPCRGSRKSESGRKSDPSQGKRVITPFYLGVIGLSI